MRSLTAIAVSCLLIAACGGDSVPTTTVPAVIETVPPTTIPATTTEPSTTTTTEPPLVSPLNGLPVEDPANMDRRVIAVKIDDHWNARPQSGIEMADAVFELPVEASLTRFIALFHDNDSTFLGPMRSGRPTDPTLIRYLGATFTISGAQPWVIGRINQAGVPLIGEIRPATFRFSGRRAPHNLYVNTELLRDAADERGYADDPPTDLFRWGDLPDESEPAREVFFDWSGTTQVTWKWAGGRYERWLGDTPHEWRSEDGETTGTVTADTLVVLFAPRYTAGGSSGSAVPAMETLGAGRALVFSGGQVVEGTWERETIEERFELADADGAPLRVPTGIPWISIFPDSRSVTW